MRGLRTASVLAAAAALVLGTAAAAQADYVTAGCSTGAPGHVLTTYTYYYTSGPNHVWTNTEYQISGKGTGGKSNVHLHLTIDYVELYNYYSPDSVKQNLWYNHAWNVAVNAASAEFMSVRGIFDVFGTDPQCTGRSVPTI